MARNNFLIVPAEVISENERERVYSNELLPILYKYYRQAEYERAADLAWQAALDEPYVSKIMNGKVINLGDPILMGLATAFAFRISKDKTKLFIVRQRYFTEMKQAREEDVAHYASYYGWGGGEGRDKIPALRDAELQAAIKRHERLTRQDEQRR